MLQQARNHKFFRLPPGKCAGHNLKLLDIVQKIFALPGVPR